VTGHSNMPNISIMSILSRAGEPRSKRKDTWRVVDPYRRGDRVVSSRSTRQGGGGKSYRCDSRPDCQGRHGGLPGVHSMEASRRSGSGATTYARAQLPARGWCSPSTSCSHSQPNPSSSAYTRRLGAHVYLPGVLAGGQGTPAALWGGSARQWWASRWRAQRQRRRRASLAPACFGEQRTFARRGDSQVTYSQKRAPKRRAPREMEGANTVWTNS
jgi:hypothetical protein